jgi:hypothetical protein
MHFFVRNSNSIVYWVIPSIKIFFSFQLLDTTLRLRSTKATEDLLFRDFLILSDVTPRLLLHFKKSIRDLLFYSFRMLKFIIVPPFLLFSPLPTILSLELCIIPLLLKSCLSGLGCLMGFRLAPLGEYISTDSIYRIDTPRGILLQSFGDRMWGRI